VLASCEHRPVTRVDPVRILAWILIAAIVLFVLFVLFANDLIAPGSGKGGPGAAPHVVTAPVPPSRSGP
jgi:hypothetical protein